VVIRNCKWIPGGGAPIQPHLFSANNSGQHDFGYPCFMPKEITIGGLVIDDSQHPKDYQGPYLFNDPDGPATATRPFPYQLAEQVTIHRLTTTSGLKFRISPDAGFAALVKVIERE
jgi:hypothetical protein